MHTYVRIYICIYVYTYIHIYITFAQGVQEVVLAPTGPALPAGKYEYCDTHHTHTTPHTSHTYYDTHDTHALSLAIWV
jgi:hypothetical protein